MKRSKKIVSSLLAVAVTVGCVGLLPTIENDTESQLALQQAQAMAESLYLDDTAEAPGLSDATNVGADKEKLENEVRYSCGNDADYVIDATGFTYQGETYGVAGSDGADDTIDLQMAIEYAKSLPEDKIKLIKLPAGDLDLIEGGNPSNPAFGIVFRDCKNIRLQGQDTTIYINGVMSTIQYYNAEDCYLESVNLDWGRTPYSMGKVMECDVDSRKVVVKVNNNYPVDEYTVIRQYVEYDQTGAVRSNPNLMYDSKIESYSFDGQVVTIYFKEPITFAPKNTNVVLAHYSYDYRSIKATHSKNLYFEDVDSWSAAGFVFEGYECENLYFNRFDVEVRPNTDRFYTGTSDGIHTNECSGEIKITNCKFENTHDDSINICGIYMALASVDKANKKVIIRAISADYPPRAGDTVEVYDKTTFEYKGRFKIETIERTSAETYSATYSGEIDFELTGNEVLCDTTRSAKVLINDCVFRNKRNRGIIVQLRDSEISNCTFANICHGSISIYTVTGQFNESLPSKNLTIKNCKFLNNNGAYGLSGDVQAVAYTSSEYPASIADVYSNITFENNFFANTSRAGLYINNMRDSYIRNNLFYNMALSYATEKSPQYNTAISWEYTENMVLEGNYNVNAPNDDFVGIFVSATGTMMDKLSLINNGGYLTTSVVEVAPAVTYDIGKIDFAVNVSDGSLSDWTGGTDLAIQAISDVNSGDVTNDVSRAEHFRINTLKAGYTDDGIYIAFDVYDDELVWLSDLWYTVDYVEFFLSTEISSKNPTSALKAREDVTCFQYVMLPDTAGGDRLDQARTSEDVISNRSAIQSKLTVNSAKNGYVGEIFIPWSLTDILSAKHAENAELALTVVFSDIAENRLRAQASTATHPVESNKYVPARMSKFRFV